MDRITAVAKIEEIKSATSDIEAQVNAIQADLLSYVDSLNQCYSKITDELVEETIISSSQEKINGIVSNISSTLEQTKTILDTLSKDATDEIKNIVDTYNSSIDPEHPETPLSYVEITLSSIAGINSITATSGGSTETPTTNNYNEMESTNNLNTSSSEVSENTSSNNTQSSSTNTSNENNSSNNNNTSNNYSSGSASGGSSSEKITLETFLSYLQDNELDSSNIPDWDNYVKEFIEDNNLSNKVSNISIKGKIVKCELTNNRELDVKNVFTSDDLVDQIVKEYNR